MPLSVHIRLARHKVLAPIVGNVALALSAFLAAACVNGAAMSSVESEAASLSVQEFSCKEIWGDWASMADLILNRERVVHPLSQFSYKAQQTGHYSAAARCERNRARSGRARMK